MYVVASVSVAAAQGYATGIQFFDQDAGVALGPFLTIPAGMYGNPTKVEISRDATLAMLAMEYAVFVISVTATSFPTTPTYSIPVGDGLFRRPFLAGNDLLIGAVERGDFLIKRAAPGYTSQTALPIPYTDSQYTLMASSADRIYVYDGANGYPVLRCYDFAGLPVSGFTSSGDIPAEAINGTVSMCVSPNGSYLALFFATVAGTTANALYVLDAVSGSVVWQGTTQGLGFFTDDGNFLVAASTNTGFLVGLELTGFTTSELPTDANPGALRGVVKTQYALDPYFASVDISSGTSVPTVYRPFNGDTFLIVAPQPAPGFTPDPPAAPAFWTDLVYASELI